MSITVFIADDHGIMRAGLRLLLESQADLKVIGESSDGRQAVREVTRLQPDVAIFDIGMPELNGIEAIRQITENGSKTHILILSMYTSTEHIFQALQAGALGYVLKSSAGEEIITATRLVHSGLRHLSRQISDELISDYLLQRAKVGQVSPLAQLSPREREIIQLVADGKSSASIADALALSTKTVETYRSRLMQKLNLNDLPSLVKFAIQFGLTSL